jgi:murein DD-endopeptidase MepM/ murein hydrolase activator NlpD
MNARLLPWIHFPALLFAAAAFAAEPTPARQSILRTVDLNKGEFTEVTLADGSKARVKLLDVQEQRDPIRNAVRVARVKVEVNGQVTTLEAGNYNLPVTFAGVQVDATITGGYRDNSNADPWGLDKDARLRFWPAGSPWIEPGTFVYPLRQRWFASGTQFANEPSFVDGGEDPAVKKIYYHQDLDFGGAEAMVEVVAATDGLVVSASGKLLAGHENTPAQTRYDVIYLLDERGWYYRYSHFNRIDVKLGDRVKMGQRLGLLGKEGASGGWSHLHFGPVSRQPSGKWGAQEGYAFVWEAYQREQRPKIIGVARPHHYLYTGDKAVLDASKSWAASGKIRSYEWTFTDGTKAMGAKVERAYAQPGTYSEVVKVTDLLGNVAWDFAVANVINRDVPSQMAPAIQAAYYPTLGLKAGQPITFKVRTFRTTHGKEVWDFGDSTTKIETQSDGAVVKLAKDGFAVTQHAFAKPGNYIVRVERANERGEKAVTHLWVEVGR